MDKITKDSEIASLRRQLRDVDAHRASIEARLAALLDSLARLGRRRRLSLPCPQVKRSGSFADCLRVAGTSSRSAGRIAGTASVRNWLTRRNHHTEGLGDELRQPEFRLPTGGL